MVRENWIPFHLQAEDDGSYLLEERSREVDRARGDEAAEGPSENNDLAGGGLPAVRTVKLRIPSARSQWLQDNIFPEHAVAWHTFVSQATAQALQHNQMGYRTNQQTRR
jgi:hypothetical protein